MFESACLECLLRVQILHAAVDQGTVELILPCLQG